MRSFPPDVLRDADRYPYTIAHTVRQPAFIYELTLIGPF